MQFGKKKTPKKDKAEKMLSARSQFANMLFVLVILAATFIFLFTNFNKLLKTSSDPVDLGDLNYAGLRWWWLIPALACLAISILSEAVNLWLLCRKVGFPRSLRQTTVYASSDIYFSAITPSATGGQPAAAYYMTKSGVPLSLSTAVLILNVTLYTIGLLFISALAFLLNPGIFISFKTSQKVFVLVGVGFHAILIAICLVCMFSRRFIFWLGDVLFGLLAKLHIVKNKEERIAAFRASVATYQSALKIVREHRWLLPVLFFNSILQRVALAPITYFVFLAMGGMGVSHMSFSRVFTTQLYCIVGASALPTPGGAGLAELLHMGVFYEAMKGIPNASSLCMFSLLLSRGISSYLAILVCGTIATVHHLRMKQAELHRRQAGLALEEVYGADDTDTDTKPEADVTVQVVTPRGTPTPAAPDGADAPAPTDMTAALADGTASADGTANADAAPVPPDTEN